MWIRFALFAPAAMSALLGACSSSPLEAPLTTGTSGSLVVSPRSANLLAGQTILLTAEGVDGERLAVQGDITWSSSNERVASVAGGNVRGTGAGRARITATWKGMRSNASVTVTSVPGHCADLYVRAVSPQVDLSHPCKQREE